MKKLMMLLAAVGLAFGVNAASFTWQSASAAYGLDASAVGDNGDYSAGTTVMNKKGTWNVILALYDTATGDLVGQSASTGVKFSTTGNKFNTTLDVAEATTGTAYNYVLTITGTQTDLTARGLDGTYDYSAASLTTTIEGSVTTAAMGATKFSSATPTTWAVSGIESAGTPEPTSGLLLLLGGAMLALRRKQK